MSISPPRASILAVGTELTTGQITNRNASWLSEKLTDLGASVVLHETVADDRAMIRDAIERCALVSTLIFITGGLGPTSDDFTRDLVGEWIGKPMQWHEPSWEHIVQRLGRFGIPVAESNRQQCYFPEGATILFNAEGTANGFMLDKGKLRAWVLPGPPREIETLWDAGIAAQVLECIPGARPKKLLTWQCLGKSEAELGEITEKALQGSGLEIGYRAHRPYVEIKVWCPEDRLAEAQPSIARLEAAIAPWVLTRQGEDLACSLLAQLRRADEVEIYDGVCRGVLAERIGHALLDPAFADVAPALSLVTEWTRAGDPEQVVTEALAQADDEVITLIASGFNDKGIWALGLRDGAITHVKTFQAPWNRKELFDRMRRYAAEIALKQWRDWLAATVQ